MLNGILSSLSRAANQSLLCCTALRIDCPEASGSQAKESCYGNQEGTWRQDPALGALPSVAGSRVTGMKGGGQRMERRWQSGRGNACMLEEEGL